MRSLKLFLVVVSLVAPWAAELTLAWDHDEPGKVSHYTVYARTNGVEMARTDSIPTNEVRLIGFPAGVLLEFYVTATSEGKESAPSESIFHVIEEAAAPAAPVIVAHQWREVFSGTLRLWEYTVEWGPVAKATGYVVVTEQLKASGLPGARQTNSTAEVSITLKAPLRNYRVSVQATNVFGISPRSEFVFSPEPEAMTAAPFNLRVVE